MHVNPDIFRAYDIRGMFPDEINAKAAYLISRAFVEFLHSTVANKELRIVVSADARPSSPELKRALLEGLLDEGVSVIDMGLTTTPFHYFGVVEAVADGGIMVTASHDIFQANGLKLSQHGGEPIGSKGLELVRNIASRAIFPSKKAGGSVTEHSPARNYIEFLIARVDLSKTKEMKIVLDAGGGMASLLLPQLVKRLPCKTSILNGDLYFNVARDALNPAREEHLAALKNAVVEGNADFGVAFDPDSDRSGFVTHNARFFRADYMGAYLARELLKRNTGAAIVHDIRSSSIFRETIKAVGGKPIESRVGHSFIKETMKKEGALFAAELSGHFYFKDFYYMDSDFLAFLYFLQFLSESKKNSDELLEEFEVYPSSGELTFKMKGGKEKTLLEEIAAHYKDARETKWIDGLALYYDDWWASIRQSNTEEPAPAMRLIVEARTKNLLDQKVAELKKFIED